MESLLLAEYAYHNCQFGLATRHVEAGAASVEAVILRVKCLCELDQGSLAKAYATLAQRDFPGSGALHYFRGMACYLAEADRNEIDAAFSATLDCGFAGGHLGKAFIAYADGLRSVALQHLARAAGLGPELEHVRQLMAFQVLLDDARFTDAEECLAAADQVLKASPSLLRTLWGQVCWIRLLTATGCFDVGSAAAGRLLDQLSPELTPRLHRNLSVLTQQLVRHQAASLINLPADHLQARVFPPEEIMRKPVLNSLWHFLASRALAGATKDEIVTQVWEQSYNPTMHDDRLYKSVGRLRKLLGDDLDFPRILYLRGANYILDLDVFRASRQARQQETGLCAISVG